MLAYHYIYIICMSHMVQPVCYVIVPSQQDSGYEESHQNNSGQHLQLWIVITAGQGR